MVAVDNQPPMVRIWELGDSPFGLEMRFAGIGIWDMGYGVWDIGYRM
jgi:hypothetical protein